ncbi:MAG TPA: cupredoxin domain-containing protein [Jatrophihabitantaceae bacterium]|nr:cupredoxin domain-containing protein [Jatrophihabitantaceae bacterium]
MSDACGGRAVRVAAVLMLAVVIAGCTNRQASPNRRGHPGSSTAAMVNGVQQVTLTVNDTFRFDPSRVVVHPGTVKITLVHKGSGAPHDFALNGFPADQTGLVNAGGTTSTTFTTPSAGTYAFECTLHVTQGMTGTLVVLPN